MLHGLASLHLRKSSSVSPPAEGLKRFSIKKFQWARLPVGKDGFRYATMKNGYLEDSHFFIYYPNK
jgi:hypothetical protein